MSKIAVARYVSIIGHPFAFILLLILLPLWVRGQLSALRVATIVGVAGLLPLGLFMRHRHATGKWATVDASDRADRPVAYLAAFAVLLPMSLYFHFVERSPALFRGGLVVALMLAVGAVLNRWIKLSGHMAFAGFSAVILGAHYAWVQRARDPVYPCTGVVADCAGAAYGFRSRDWIVAWDAGWRNLCMGVVALYFPQHCGARGRLVYRFRIKPITVVTPGPTLKTSVPARPFMTRLSMVTSG